VIPSYEQYSCVVFKKKKNLAKNKMRFIVLKKSVQKPKIEKNDACISDFQIPLTNNGFREFYQFLIFRKVKWLKSFNENMKSWYCLNITNKSGVSQDHWSSKWDFFLISMFLRFLLVPKFCKLAFTLVWVIYRIRFSIKTRVWWIVKTVFLCDVSIRSHLCLKWQKHAWCYVTPLMAWSLWTFCNFKLRLRRFQTSHRKTVFTFIT